MSFSRQETDGVYIEAVCNLPQRHSSNQLNQKGTPPPQINVCILIFIEENKLEFINWFTSKITLQPIKG